jgi:hypothetical protein
MRWHAAARYRAIEGDPGHDLGMRYAAHSHGTFFCTGIADVCADPSTGLINPAMITPAQPFSVYGGVNRCNPLRFERLSASGFEK